MLFFAQLARSSIVTYTSSIQLKNVYSKNRLGVEISKKQTYDPPVLYSSRPPYDSGWFWTIGPDEENISLARENINCGSTITLSSPTTELYLSAKSTSNGIKPVAVNHRHEAADQWILQCNSNSTLWQQDEHVLLQNLKHKCYLTTSLGEKIPNTINKFEVGCSETLTNEAVWKAVEGIYFVKSEEPKAEEDEKPIGEDL